ncbi:MAG TPA: c-type cytochrome, partial [Candidatus Synoicihabitans sp.]|nr:c-type cytochrome [Candidatus Synoicihabitans sp.]
MKQAVRSWLRRGSLILAAAAVGGFLVAASGIIPITASSGHWPITKWLLRFGMERSTATHSWGIDVPPLDDPALVLVGAGHYETSCRACHGAPDTPKPRVAQAMTPTPPELAARIRESNPKQLFYVVKHGIKFTGMPAWPAQSRDDEVWAMVAFLLKYPELDGAGYRHLVHGEIAPVPPMQTMAPLDVVRPPPRQVAQTCARCHGENGHGRGGAFPKLAGQRQEYLVNAMLAYADGSRHSGIMEPVAAGLTEELIHELATYYAASGTRAPTEPPPADRESEDIARGREIALRGIPERRVPACVECHG